MDSDLPRRLSVLLQGLPAEARSGLSLSRLSATFGVTEAEIQEALEAAGFTLTGSALHFDQTVSGTANTQVGNANTQVNVTVPLLQVHGGREAVPSLEDLRQWMGDPDAFHDALEHHLLRRRSRRTLTRVLTVSTGRPEWEALFQGWVRHAPEIQCQPWFVRPTFTHYAEALTGETACSRHDFLVRLTDGLLRAGHTLEALELFRSLQGQLEDVQNWTTSHWNVLYSVVEQFWFQSEFGEARPYPSGAVRDETQFWLTLSLTQTACHLCNVSNANNINQFLIALAHLVQNTRTDETILLIEHCTEDEWLAEVLELQTARELLNGLDHARSPSTWSEGDGTQQERLLRHSLVDGVARQILNHVEQQIGRSDSFFDLVRRAGMTETAKGKYVSRYTLAVEKPSGDR